MVRGYVRSGHAKPKSIEVHRPVGDNCIVQLGWRHPFRLESCALVFEKDKFYVFSGIRDVDRLMDEVEDVGLYLIARPSPFINAELSGGGIPTWLLRRHR